MMKAEQEFQVNVHRSCRVVVALALLSSLAACSKQEPPTPAASAENQGTNAPPPTAQVAPSAVETAPVIAMEKQPKVSKPNPDETLATMVKSKLNDEGFGAFALDVVSSNGSVTLYGTVDSTKTRDNAGRLASSVAGVRSVANQLVVIRGS
jgi:hyperosmotically inducible protein